MQQSISFIGDFGGDMTERPRKATRLTVSLEEQDYRMLNQIALARDASLSWVIRQAIRQFIESTPKAGERRDAPQGDGARGKR
jgi:predicted transcriptional regulator